MTLRKKAGVPNRACRVIVDTGPMLVLAVGAIEPRLLGQAKRMEKYDPDDYRRLLTFLSEFRDGPLTTPNVLTETSNLLRQSLKGAFERFFVAAQSVITEEYVTTSKAVTESLFPVFGLTDSTLRSLASDEQLLLTDDFSLYQATVPNAVNLMHLRNWDS